MKAKLSTSQIQKQIFVPAIQQSIELLILPILDLNMAIEQELQTNPLLEIEENNDFEGENFTEQLQERIDKQDELSRLSDGGFDHMEEDQVLERPFAKDISLEEKLMEQMRIDLPDPIQRKIGEYIIGNIDEDGYLKSTIEEIAQNTEIYDTVLIEKVLKTIQEYEPKGIAARNINECLLLQAKTKSNGHYELVCRIISEHFHDLGKKKYLFMAKSLGVSLEEVKAAAQIISKLEPKPARNFRPISPNIYVKPDVVIWKDPNQGYQIQVNRDGIPTLKINPMYKRLLHLNNVSDSEKEYIKEKLRNALHFIKSIEQRGHTLTEITKYILNKQKQFLEKGPVALVPMNLNDVATAINRNESTISRAISGKYIETPQGFYPLKFFFTQGLSENNETSISNRSIKESIKELVEHEDKKAPLSDQDILEHFEKNGMNVARRTIAKYRQELNIFPSHLRKE